MDDENSRIRRLCKPIREREQPLRYILSPDARCSATRRLFHSSFRSVAVVLIEWVNTGPLARIGPNHLLTSDPITTQKILGVRSKYTRGPWYDSLRIDPHRTNLVTERDSRRHNDLRQRLSFGVINPFSYAFISGQLTYITVHRQRCRRSRKLYRYPYSRMDPHHRPTLGVGPR